jgi:hypothetical protein
MGDGGWAMEDGGWAMEDGRWKMGDGRWAMEYLRWVAAGLCEPLPRRLSRERGVFLCPLKSPRLRTGAVREALFESV